MHQCQRARWLFLAITGGTAKTRAVGRGDPSFPMIKSLAVRCSASGLRLALVPSAIKPASDHTTLEFLAQKRHVGSTGGLGVVPADNPRLVGIKEEPASTAKAEFLRWLINQGRGAKTEGLPKALHGRIALPNQGIPEGGENQVMAA